MKRMLSVAAVLCAAVLAAESTDRIFPFPMEGEGLWNAWEGGARREPAGSDGFLRTKGNDFIDGTGQVRRFLGVNLYGPAQLPEKAVADRTAKLLSWWGINAVRLMPQYTWQKRADQDFSKGIDPELLDRFDYLFAKLKERGIYATMNLHSARTAGYRFKDFKQTMKENKGLDTFDPTFIQHQKEYIRTIFDHVNPYTGLAYRDEPAVMSWEINNECSLPICWFTWNLWDKMTPPFRAELTRQFTDWLKVKYGTMEALRAAWQIEKPMQADWIAPETWTSAEGFAKAKWYTEGFDRGGQGPRTYRFEPSIKGVVVDAASVRKFALIGYPLEQGDVYTVSLRIRSDKPTTAILKVSQHGRPYGNQGVLKALETGPDWQEVRVRAAARVTDGDNRVQIEFKRGFSYEISGLSLVKGGVVGVTEKESLAAGNIVPQGEGSQARERDVSEFIFDVEDRYWKEMVRFVKDEMKARVPVNAGTFDYGAGYPQAYGDFIDNHVYNGGLANWPGRAWDPKNWSCKNRSVVAALDVDIMRELGPRVFGKPYTISEASQMHQAATASDFFPILFSLAAFQNFSAVHAYTWTHAQDHSYGPSKWLDIHGNAKYLAHWPAARNMFVRGDVKSGATEPSRIVYDVRRAEEREDLHQTGFTAKTHVRPVDPTACLKAMTGCRYVDLPLEEGVPSVAATPYGAPPKTERKTISSTGEIVWDATTQGRERYVVDTPRTKFVSMFGPERTQQQFRDGTVFTLGKTLMDWAAISLTEVKTNEWLLAATGYQQPTGAVLQIYGQKTPLKPEACTRNLDGTITTCKGMGRLPFMCEGVRATIRVPAPKGKYCALVHALDGHGRVMGVPLTVDVVDGFATFDISEADRTVWYRITFRLYDLPAYGDPIPGSGYDPKKPDRGMSAAAVFDGPIEGLKKIGTLAMTPAKEIPETSPASIGFECLDRKLFEPTDEVYARLGACGVKWARVQSMWSRCETEKGKYDFSALDEIVDKLCAQGIRPWLSVSFGNTLYMKHCYTKAAVGCVPLYYGEECRQAWLAYARELAKRYKGKVTHWEIWNECNLPQFWQPRAPNARDYVELVKITGEAIKSQDPTAKIGGVSSGMGIRAWEKEFFEAGGGSYIDFWCGHAYGCVPELYRGQQRVTTRGQEPDFVREMAWVRDFMDTHGAKHVEFWQGESGFPSWFPNSHWLFPRGVCQEGWQSQANQAKWLLRRWLTDRRAGFARSSFFQACDITRHYSMATTTQKHPAEHGVLNGWTKEPKMSYYALANWNTLFASATYDATVPVTVSPVTDAGVQTKGFAFTRTISQSQQSNNLFLVYYAPFDFSLSYTGKVYRARTDAQVAVPVEQAPKDPVLVDLLRGGVYTVPAGVHEGEQIVFKGLPLVDYPLVLIAREAICLVETKGVLLLDSADAVGPSHAGRGRAGGRGEAVRRPKGGGGGGPPATGLLP